eukprot:scaffold69515_cov58-Attheya_sp.AAC.4
MDQVPLPFVVEQERTFTSHNDAHVHIRSCVADGLTKRQYTMHIFVNAGDGQDGVCYVELIARGKGQCISQVDKAERHGNHRVLLFADNLDAHCWEEVFNEFAQSNVLVLFVVPGCTDAIQPIDAGIGWSIRIYIGQELDTWLSMISGRRGSPQGRLKKLPYSIPAALTAHLSHLQQSSRPAEVHVPDETLPSSSIEENETDDIHDNATTADNAVTTVELTN